MTSPLAGMRWPNLPASERLTISLYRAAWRLRFAAATTPDIINKQSKSGFACLGHIGGLLGTSGGIAVLINRVDYP